MVAFRGKISKMTRMKPTTDAVPTGRISLCSPKSTTLWLEAPFNLQLWEEEEMSPAPHSVAQGWCKREQRFKCCSVTLSARLYRFPEAWQWLQHALHQRVLPHLRHQRHHLQEQVPVLYCCGVSEGPSSEEGFWISVAFFWHLEHKGVVGLTKKLHCAHSFSACFPPKGAAWRWTCGAMDSATR